jgi:glycosyltransferase involved in cell wall biosynthesis
MDYKRNDIQFRVSVIIPVYNSRGTVEECIRSVLNQTFDCVKEIIVVDDGSADNGYEVVEKLAIEESRIVLIRKENGGAASARNTGLKLATGEYIAFLDSDDKWAPEKLSVQMEYLAQHPDVYMLGGRYGNDKLPNRVLMEHEKIMYVKIKHQVLKNFFSTPTVIFKKEILDRIGYFDEKMKYAEEGYFFNKIVANYKSVYMATDFAANISGKKRWGDSGLSGNVVKMETGELHYIKEAYRAKFIPFRLFLFACIFSIIKFCRRYVILMIRKLRYNNLFSF